MQTPHNVSLDPLALEVCQAVKAAGGTAYVIGGTTRDLFRFGILNPTNDVDLEAHEIPPARLREVLSQVGASRELYVQAVGEAFMVYKLGHVDVSIPRADSRPTLVDTGRHPIVTGDPYMGIMEATRRRDFTVNGISWDPITDIVHDPFGGINDLQEGLLKVIDPARFPDDPLRVMRAMRLSAQTAFLPTEETREICRFVDLTTLPAERLQQEFIKMLLAPGVQLGLMEAASLGIIHQLFPELEALMGVEQHPEWHPEGDVWEHTMQVAGVARGFIRDLEYALQVTVMLAAVCHDFGKPSTTEIIDGKVKSLGHEGAGIEPTRQFLNTLNIHTINGYNVRAQVLALVADHLAPGHLYTQHLAKYAKGQHFNPARAIRRLSRKVNLDLLYRVAKADSLGRYKDGARHPDAVAQEWFIAQARDLQVDQAPPGMLINGRDLIDPAFGYDLKPGPYIGAICKAVYELQLDGEVTTREEGLLAAKAYVRANPRT